MKQSRDIIIAIVGIAIIGIVISYFYSVDLTKNQGLVFGNDLKSIQDELKTQQTQFSSKYTTLNENAISTEEFLEFSNTHIKKIDEFILRYDKLSPPESFASAVELLKLSTISQLESDKELIEWIKTGDERAKIRSDLLLQEAFDYEMAGLNEYNSAKAGINP